MVRLNRSYYLLLKFHKQTFFKIGSFGQNSSKFRKFCAIRPHRPRIPRNSHYLLIYYTLCFRHLPRQRTLQNSSELCKFRTIHPQSPRITQNSHLLLTYLMFQTPAPAENSQKFQPIMQIPRGSPT